MKSLQSEPVKKHSVSHLRVWRGAERGQEKGFFGKGVLQEEKLPQRKKLLQEKSFFRGKASSEKNFFRGKAASEKNFFRGKCSSKEGFCRKGLAAQAWKG